MGKERCYTERTANGPLDVDGNLPPTFDSLFQRTTPADITYEQHPSTVNLHKPHAEILATTQLPYIEMTAVEMKRITPESINLA